MNKDEIKERIQKFQNRPKGQSGGFADLLKFGEAPEQAENQLSGLIRDRDGNIPWAYYASLDGWDYETCIQILEEANPGKKKLIEDTFQLSLKSHNRKLMDACKKYIEEREEGLKFEPGKVILWAIEKEFSVPDYLLDYFYKKSTLELEEQKRLKAEADFAVEQLDIEIELAEKQETPEPVGEVSEEPKEQQTAGVSQKETSGIPADKNTNHDTFIRNLRVWCNNEIEIKIQAQGQTHITCNPDALGFKDALTKEWLALIELLKSPEGTFFYSCKKIDSAKKACWKRIEKKLIAYLKNNFNLDFPVGFKLFESVPGGKGIRKPLFQIKERTVERNFDFSSLDKVKTIEQLKIMARVDDPESAEKMVALEAHAEEIGLKRNEIDLILDTERQFRRTGSDTDICPQYDQTDDDLEEIE